MTPLSTQSTTPSASGTERRVAAPEGGTPALTATREEYARAAVDLAHPGPIACDVERAHGFTYSARAYLLQFRTCAGRTVLADPVAPDAEEGLAALSRVLEGRPFIMHAADQDLASMREVGIRPGALVDTEIASLILGLERVGLAAVTSQLLSVELSKNHQVENWSTRPLPESWLTYAALDVEFLFPLARALTDRLEAAGRAAWAEQEYAHVLAEPPRPPAPDPWRVKGWGKIRSRRTLAYLRALWEAREEAGRERNVSPARIIPTRDLVPLAAAAEAGTLARNKAWGSGRVRRNRARWEAAFAHASELAPEDYPSRTRPLRPGDLPDPHGWRQEYSERYERLQQLRHAVNSRADDLGIRSEVLLNSRVLKRLAWEGLRGQSLEDRLTALGARPWQIEQSAGSLANVYS